MAITKIEDLVPYCYDDRTINGYEEGVPYTEYYEKKGVKELVNHLQLKSIKWRKAKDELPSIGEYCVLFRLKSHPGQIQSGAFFTKQNGDYAFSGLDYYKPEQVDFWCYQNDLLKTLPEEK